MNPTEQIEVAARAESGAPTFKAGRLRPLVRALRVHQWIKNLLVFVPLLMAHEVSNTDALARTAYAFLAWCLCASSVYLVNDLLDVEADRLHPYKKQRPLAAGEIGAGSVWALVPLLLVPAFALAFLLLPPFFGLTLLIYLALTTLYSLFLKRLMIVDVLALAGLYTLRVVSGGVATGVVVSPWLLAFSMFLFLSLAFVKRYVELRAAGSDGRLGAGRRDYVPEDMEMLRSFGTASGYLSVLVLVLYINNSREVVNLYRHPTALWLIGPCLLYWITRVWLLAHRGRVHDDPLIFTVKDPVSYALGAIIAAIIIFSAL